MKQTLRGVVASSPLPLDVIRDRGLTGTLVIRAPNRDVRLFSFRDGAPVRPLRERPAPEDELARSEELADDVARLPETLDVRDAFEFHEHALETCFFWIRACASAGVNGDEEADDDDPDRTRVVTPAEDRARFGELECQLTQDAIERRDLGAAIDHATHAVALEAELPGLALDDDSSGERTRIVTPGDGAQSAGCEALAEVIRAEVALERNDLPAALAHATRAVELEPEQRDFNALRVWAAALNGGSPQAAIRALDEILFAESTNARALYYRGKLLDRTGRSRAALDDFVALLHANPTHRHALSEVRLLRKRLLKGRQQVVGRS